MTEGASTRGDAADDSAPQNHGLRFPAGDSIEGVGPVVIVGPNGSGKSRQARDLQADKQPAVVNALRNTRVAPEIQAMGVVTARNNVLSQVTQARTTHWELSSEFDSMLSQLLAESAQLDSEFARRFRRDPSTAGSPEETALSKVEALWATVFPGRELVWKDWKPVVLSETAGGEAVEYSGHTMSDGEKSALFLAARTFSADPGVLIVDEPETHLHSLLAARLWNELEDARRDIRFVYVTHDLTFALSRRDATYVLSSPTDGLKRIELQEDLPAEVASMLLGVALLSFSTPHALCFAKAT